MEGAILRRNGIFRPSNGTKRHLEAESSLFTSFEEISRLDCEPSDRANNDSTNNDYKSTSNNYRTTKILTTTLISILLLIDLKSWKSDAEATSHQAQLGHFQTATNWPHRARHKRQAQATTPTFTEPIGNHTVPIGRDVQLWCKTTNLENKFRTAWLRVEDKQILSIHDSIITRNYRIGVIVNEASSVLTIKNVQESDRGGYMCQINSVPMKYALGYLDVLIPPTFERDTGQSSAMSELNVDQDSLGNRQDDSLQPSSSIVVAQEGSNATLACKARAYPEPTIQWRREDNEPIDVASSSSTNRESLHFKQVSRMQAGAYLCIASNGVPPAASKRLLLDVQFAPVVRVPESEVLVSFVMPQAQSEAQLSALATAQWGRPVAPSVQLRCHVELNPGGSFHWLRVALEQQSREWTPLEMANIEADQLTNSDKYEIVILDDTSKQASASPSSAQTSIAGRKSIEMRLNIRMPNKLDLGSYRCLTRNSLGSQWGLVKLVEMSQAQLLASQQQSRATTSSSPFAFKELFRFASSDSSTNTNQQAPDSPSTKATRSKSHARSNNQSTRSHQQQHQTSNSHQNRLAWTLSILVAISSVAQYFANLQQIR